nr:MAG TPA: hypothetical protein [Caudoviricetes sp.]
MPRAGQTTVDFNQEYFDNILKDAEIDGLCKEKAEQALAIARAEADNHVDTGSYRDQLAVERVPFDYRNAWQVVGHDPKTMILEDRYHILANAMKKVK